MIFVIVIHNGYQAAGRGAYSSFNRFYLWFATVSNHSSFNLIFAAYGK